MSDPKHRSKPRKPTKSAIKKPTVATKLSLAEAFKPGAFTDEELRAAWTEALAPLYAELSQLKKQLADKGVRPFLAGRSSRDLPDDVIRPYFPDMPFPELQLQYRALTEKLFEESYFPLMKYRKEYQAEGDAFRDRFMDMTPAEVNRYLREYQGPDLGPINAWWLAGFSRDPVMIERMGEISRRPRRRKPKWSTQVRDVAEAAYQEWTKNANQPHPAWETTWGAFAKACISLIEQKTGVRVPEETLRRSILPAKKFPRPD